MVIRKFCLLIWNAQTTKAVFSQPAISFSFVGMLYGLPISSELQIRFFSFIAACVLVGRGIRKGPSKPIIFLKSMHSTLEQNFLQFLFSTLHHEYLKLSRITLSNLGIMTRAYLRGASAGCLKKKFPAHFPMGQVRYYEVLL